VKFNDKLYFGGLHIETWSKLKVHKHILVTLISVPYRQNKKQGTECMV